MKFIDWKKSWKIFILDFILLYWLVIKQIICIRKESLKPCECIQIIFISNIYLKL